MTARRTASKPSRTIPLPSESELRRIVQDGDANLTVQHAQAIGERLAAQLTSSQIRNLFTTVRQIEMNWPVRPKSAGEEERAIRQLILLKPKLAYQASREQRGGIGMKALRDLLTPAIDLVGDNREHFQNFVDFFEAIVAYHTSKED